MTPGELLAVLDALPGVQVETHWPIPEGEFDPQRDEHLQRVDDEPIGAGLVAFEVRLEDEDERSKSDGYPDRRDLPTHR